MLGIAHRIAHKPNELSGGQKQRVAIARALVGQPAILLADEPTGALDSVTSREVIDFLKELNNQGNTIVLITHDNFIAAQAKRVIRITDGKAIYDGPPENDKIIKQTVFDSSNDDGGEGDEL